MYDSCNFGFILAVGSDVEQQFTTAPAWLNCTDELNPKGYLTSTFGPDAGKMRVGYNPDTGRGYVKGGLQSFHHGHNSGPFPFADALAACVALVAALRLPPNVLQVRTLETGLNVPTPTAPTDFIDAIRHARFKGKAFESMPTPKGRPRPLGYYAPFSEQRIKVYNKGADSILKNRPLPIGGNGIRF